MDSRTYLSLSASDALAQMLQEAFTGNTPALNLLDHWTDLTVDAVNSQVILSSNALSDQGLIGQYTGSVTIPYTKRNLNSLLPYPFVFPLPYPTTKAYLATYLEETYQIVLDDGEFEVEGNSLSGGLSGSDPIDATPDPDSGRITLTALPASGRFIAGTTLAIRPSVKGVPVPLKSLLRLTSALDYTLLTDHLSDGNALPFPMATTWADSFNQASGNGVFGFEFNVASEYVSGTTTYLTDISGNGADGVVHGTVTLTDQGDPSTNGIGVASVANNGYITLPQSAQVMGDGARTLIAVVYLTPASFVIQNNEQVIYMGGGDTGGPTLDCFGLATSGSGTSPVLWLDLNRTVGSVALPLEYLNTWVTILLDHTPGVGQTMSIAKAGDQAFTVLKAWTDFIPLATNAQAPLGNWIFQWNTIRRFTGQCAFIGMKDAVFTDDDRRLFVPATVAS